jgi:hypothetical protein
VAKMFVDDLAGLVRDGHTIEPRTNVPAGSAAPRRAERAHAGPGSLPNRDVARGQKIGEIR